MSQGLTKTEIRNLAYGTGVERLDQPGVVYRIIDIGTEGASIRISKTRTSLDPPDINDRSGYVRFTELRLHGT